MSADAALIGVIAILAFVVGPIFTAAQLAKSRDGRIGTAMLLALALNWLGVLVYLLLVYVQKSRRGYR